MKLRSSIIAFITVIYSMMANASELPSFLELKDLSQKNVTLKISIDNSTQVAGRNFSGFCRTEFPVASGNTLIQKGSYAFVEKIETKKGKTGYSTFLEGYREPYAEAVFTLKSLDVSNEEVVFKLTCTTTMERKTSLNEVMTNEVELISKIIQL